MPDVPSDEEWRAREMERQARRDANGRDARHAAAIVLGLLLAVLVLLAYLNGGST